MLSHLLLWHSVLLWLAFSWWLVLLSKFCMVFDVLFFDIACCYVAQADNELPQSLECWEKKTHTTTPIISSTFPYAYQLCALSYSLLTILFLACFPHSLKLICIFQRAFVRRFCCSIFAVSDSLLVLFIHSRFWQRRVLDFNKNHFNHHFVVNALVFWL